MDLQSFLTYLLTAGGTGAAVYAILELADRYLTLPPEFKRIAAPALTIVIPVLAYTLQVQMGWSQVDGNSLFAVGTVIWLGLAYIGSQGFHKLTEKPR